MPLTAAGWMAPAQSEDLTDSPRIVCEYIIQARISWLEFQFNFQKTLLRDVEIVKNMIYTDWVEFT
jgi:hypothetical protein